MPVKIVLYAENIAVGTEVVSFALKAGAALDRYEQSDPPIKPNGTGRNVSPDERRLYDKGFRGKGSLKQQAFGHLSRMFGDEPFTRADAVNELRCADWDHAQATQTVAALVKTGHIAP